MPLEINHLTGGYAGVSVIKDLSLTVNDGECVGLIGLNGAGKSTTIKHVLGLLRPQAGEITLDGQAGGYKKDLAYIPEMPVLYPELTLKEHLDLVILNYQLDPTAAWEKAHVLLKKFRLDNKLDWMPINFSKGMQQKVMIVSAFLADTKLLIVDEPFTGLDPLAVMELLKLLNEAKKAGKIILMSTHILTNASQVVDHYAVLNQGQIEAFGQLSDLREKYQMTPDQPIDQIYQLMLGEKFDA
ncbi:MAG: ABC transporter ATP-binding protein [Lactobacillus sp.]|nr:ABC transporter ATP-binding protein [Lactobacillus sp.]